jgi:uncharacterized protein (TIGR02452 family)
MRSLIHILDETLAICYVGEYENNGKKTALPISKEDMEKATVFSDKQIKELVKNYDCEKGESVTKFKVENITSFEAAKNLSEENPSSEILVLNFANPVHPGGGVRHGARAQEEDLCRKSTLLKSLESDNARAYYEYNKKQDALLSSDNMIISPKVTVIRNADNSLSDKPFNVSVLTCAAPIFSPEKMKISPEKYEELLYNRIKGMLCLAKSENYKNLVLGAWGCGAFGNDADVVARLFLKAFEELNSPFENVVMAVFDRSRSKYNYKMFEKYFG